MRIWVDRERLAAYELTVQDIENALRAQNVELPSGPHREQRPRVHRAVADRPRHPGAVRRHRGQARAADHQVRLRDVARVELGAAGRAPRQPLQRQPGHRRRHHQAGDRQPARRLAKAVERCCPTINQSLPEGMSAEIGNDSAVFIDRSIKAVFHDHRRGDRPGRPGDLVLPALVPRRADSDRHDPGVADRHLRADVCARASAINTLTLLAMVLAIGLVVDDAIVVLENIYRHIEDGMKPVGGGDQGHPGDRLRRHRDDADAGRGLRAGRVRARPHRQAVHRIRPDARRRGARLGLRRADADADDVLEAAAAQSEPGRLFRAVERGFTAFEHGYRRWLDGVAARPVAGARSWPSCVAALGVRVFLSPAGRSWRRSRIAA